MPITMKMHKGHRTGLVAVCDVCGAEVENANEANLCWSPKLDQKVGDTFTFLIACKDECTRVLDRKFGHQNTQELELAIGYLMHNTKADFKRMRETMELMAELD